MPIQMPCANCRQVLLIADHLAGRTISCPKCSAMMKVPMPASSRRPGAPGTAAQPQAAASDELELQPVAGDAAPPPPKPSAGISRCPSCGRDAPPDAVVCIACGYDFKTGLVRKSFAPSQRNYWRRLADSALRTAVGILVLVGSVWGLYYAYNQGAFKFIGELIPGAPKEGEKGTGPEQPAAQQAGDRRPEAGGNATPSTTSPAAQQAGDRRLEPLTGKAPPKTASESALEIVNERFTALLVFVNREKVAEVALGKTLRLTLPTPPKDKPLAISFEARLARTLELDDKTRKALEGPLSFAGTAAAGLRVRFKGPDPKIMPSPDEVFPNLIPGLEVTRDAATGTGLVRALKYKDVILKPVPPRTALALNWKETEKGTQLCWVAQDCIVERGGAVVYTPPAVPYEAEALKLQ